VKGNVTDEKGEALIGATVRVSGGTEGTITDIDGNYSIATTARSTLTFSYIGYHSVDMPVNGKTAINVILKSEVGQLDEVVIIAYGTQKKASITGAISNVNNTELLKSPNASLGNALTGRLPGLSSVQYSGRPGGDDANILVRGVGSLSSSNSTPLILVDGVERSFSQLDPNEVADIAILKDASATAVFGVRGANGVILVTTKRGEAGKTNISFSGSWGMSVPTDFLDFANSYDYATAYNNAQLSDGISPNQLKYSKEAIQAFKNHSQPLLYPDMDWIDYILKDYSLQSQYNMNISGGNETARFFISAGIFKQGGLFETYNADPNENFSYDRYNYRANLDINMSKTTTLSLTSGGRLEVRTEIGGGEDNLFTYLMDSPPMAGAGIVDGKRIVANKEYVGDYARDGLDTFYGQGYTRSYTHVLNFDLQLVQKLDMITSGLSFKIKGSYNGNYNLNKARNGSLPTYQPVKLADGGIGFQKSGDVGNLGYNESNGSGRNWYAEAGLDYARQFGAHNVTALLLYNQTKNYYPWPYSDIPTGYVGLVGRVTYNYNSRYLLDLNMGYNGSENFAPGKRYGLFPSASVGWVPTAEAFLEDSDFLSYLKVRYSYGIVGNDRSGSRFLYLPGSYDFSLHSGAGMYRGSGYNFGTNINVYQPVAHESSLGNPNVSWETAVKQNIGVDVKFFRDRLSMTADVFKEERRDILITPDATIPNFVALPSNPPINYGKVENKGYEITVTWEDNIGDVRYRISPNMSFNRNKIIEMMEIRQDYDYQYHTGHKVDQPFGYEFWGFYEGPESEAKYTQQFNVNKFPTQMAMLKPGDCIYVDLNGDGKIDTFDQHAIGYTNFPEYSFGLNLGASYKGFSLSALWVGATNVSRQLGYIYRPQFGEKNLSSLSQWVLDNSWTEETKNTAILPRLTFNNVQNNTLLGGNSKVWLVDTPYARLKNLEVSYTFTKLPQLKFINNARVYISGYNLITLSSFRGNDPENTGGAYGSSIRYPLTRVFNLGLSLNFK
ncbi:TonB-dependent receptor SusC, partial [termite gut metagenome]